MGLSSSTPAAVKETKPEAQEWQNFPRVIATLIEEYAVEPPPLRIQTLESTQVVGWSYTPKLVTRDAKLAIFIVQLRTFECMVVLAPKLRHSTVCVDLSTDKTVWESPEVLIQGYVQFVELADGDFIVGGGNLALRLARDTGKTLDRIVAPYIARLFVTTKGFPWISQPFGQVQPLFHDSPSTHASRVAPETLGFDHFGFASDTFFLGDDKVLLRVGHNLGSTAVIRTFISDDQCVATTEHYRRLHILRLGHETETTREFVAMQSFEFANDNCMFNDARFFTQEIWHAGRREWLITAALRNDQWLRLDTGIGQVTVEPLPYVGFPHTNQLGDRICVVCSNAIYVFEHMRPLVTHDASVHKVCAFRNVVLFFDPKANRWRFVK